LTKKALTGKPNARRGASPATISKKVSAGLWLIQVVAQSKHRAYAAPANHGKAENLLGIYLYV